MVSFLKHLLLLLFFNVFAFIQAQNVTQIEYFFNTDPGFNNGTDVSFAPSSTVDVEFTTDVSSLSSGVHTLFTRAKDSNGNWSLTQQHTFYKTAGVGSGFPNINYVEYFFNTDPSYGAGTSVPLSSIDSTIDQSFTANIDGLPNGVHTLFVRARDNYNRWSLLQQHTFYKETGFGKKEVTQIEYFWDTDPGFGNAIQVVTYDSSKVDLYFGANTIGLSQGVHSLSIRAKDTYGNWSLLSRQVVNITACTVGTPLAPFATALSPQNIKIQWTDYCFAEGYALYRSDEQNGFYQKIYEGANTSYEDSDDNDNSVEAGTTYFYKLRIITNNDDTDFSLPISVTTPTTGSVLLADLKPFSFSINEEELQEGANYTASVGIVNEGNLEAQPTKLQLFLVKNQEAINWNIPLSQKIQIGNLVEGEELLQDVTFSVPNVTSGNYYIGIEVDVDYEIDDADRPNNRGLVTQQVFVQSSPANANTDLRVLLTDVDETIIANGGATTISFTVSNDGPNSSPAQTTRVCLSTNSFYDLNDFMWADISIPSIPSGEVINITETLDFPVSLVGGNYYLGVRADIFNIVTETSEANNTDDWPIKVNIVNGEAITITGRITDWRGSGVGNIVIDGLPNSPVTDFSGYFSAEVPSGWTGRIEPIPSHFQQKFIFENGKKYLDTVYVTSNPNLIPINELDVFKVGLEIVKLEQLPGLLRDNISNDILQDLEFAQDALEVLGFALDAADIAFGNDDEITKFLSATELLFSIVGNGTLVGAIATNYIFILNETLQVLDATLVEYYRQYPANFFQSVLDFKLQIKSGNKKLDPAEYIQFIDAKLLLLEPTANQTFSTLETVSMILTVGNNKRLIMEPAQDFSSANIILDDSKVVMLELVWNKNRYDEHTMWIPMKEPFIRSVSVTSEEYKIDFKSNTNETSIGSFSISGTEKLKIQTN